METVTASQLRKDLFRTLDHVAKGNEVQVNWRGHEVARIIPVRHSDWRKKMSVQPKIKGAPEQAFAPMDELWAETGK